MAKHSYTYRFKVSTTNNGYDNSQENKPEYIPDEIIFTFGQEVDKFVECDNGTFVIKREDVRFREPITLKKNIDVLHYKLRKIVSSYLDCCGVDKQDTCIVEYELLRKNKFAKDEFISENLRDEIGFMVNAIKAIGDNTLIDPKKEIAAMHFEIPLNYVSSEIYSILNVRTTSDSPNIARKYLRDFIAAFFRLIPKDVIEKYDTLYEKREKERVKNAARDKESGKILSSIDRSKTYNGKAFALVSNLIKDLKQEIENIIQCVYIGQKFCFESFAHWKKAVIAFLEIEENKTKYEDKKSQEYILSEISDESHITKVEELLFKIDKQYNIREKNKAQASAIFYKFLTVCPSKYLNNKYKRGDKELKRKEFKDLCLQYFGLEPNSIKPKDLVKVKNIELDTNNVWNKIK